MMGNQGGGGGSGAVAWYAGMTAAYGRKQSRIEQSLLSVGRAGWNEVVLCIDGLREGPLPTFYWCLRRLHQLALADGFTRDAFLVVFQDDISVTAGLRSSLEADLSLSQNAVTSLFTPANLHHESGGWHEVQCPASCGAQALVFSYQVANRFLHSGVVPQKTGIDWWVSKWCAARGVPWLVHSLSFVRHDGVDDSALDRPNYNRHLRQCREWLPAAGAKPIVVP